MLLAMKRIYLIVTLLMTVMLMSCQQDSTSIKHFSFRTEKGNFWGMMSPDGKVMFDGKFMYAPGADTRGVFLSREEIGKYAFYTCREQPQRINNELYDLAKPFLLSDYTPVKRDGDSNFSVINIKGETVATLPDSIIDIGLFSSGLAPFVTDSHIPLMGYIDPYGSIVIPARYSLATNFVYGVALVEEIIKGIPSVSIIDYRGTIIYTFGNEWQPLATEYSDGLLPVINIRQEIGFLNTRGELAIAPNDNWALCRPQNPATIPYTFKNGHCIFSDGHHYGLMDKRGNIVVPAQYLNIYLGEGGLFAAENKEHNWGVIDCKGNVIVPFEHLPGVIRPSITPQCIVMQNEAQRFRLINHKGEVISKPFSNYQTK